MATPNAELRNLLREVAKTAGFRVEHKGQRAHVYGPLGQATILTGSTYGVNFHEVEKLLRHVGWLHTPGKKKRPAHGASEVLDVSVEANPEPNLDPGVLQEETHMGTPTPPSREQSLGEYQDEVLAFLKAHAPQRFTADELASHVVVPHTTAASRAATLSYFWLDASQTWHPEWLHVHRSESQRPYTYWWSDEPREQYTRPRRKLRLDRRGPAFEPPTPPAPAPATTGEALFEFLVDLPDGAVLLRRDDGAIFEAKLLRGGR